MSRRAYLDWLRGVAVLITIEAHTLDSWTREADRVRDDYKWSIVVGGFGAPIFLFLAGVALALAAASRRDKGMSEAGRRRPRARRRGGEIFGLAFLFRLQSAVLGGGSALIVPEGRHSQRHGVVDVRCSAAMGRCSPTVWPAAIVLVTAALAVAMLTPIVRETTMSDWLPDPIEAYVKPLPAYTGFTCCPGRDSSWRGRLLGYGSARRAARTTSGESCCGWHCSDPRWSLAATRCRCRRSIGTAISGRAHPRSSPCGWAFWSAPFRSPMRWTALARGGRSPIQELGIASLFVYWVQRGDGLRL